MAESDKVKRGFEGIGRAINKKLSKVRNSLRKAKDITKKHKEIKDDDKSLKLGERKKFTDKSGQHDTAKDARKDQQGKKEGKKESMKKGETYGRAVWGSVLPVTGETKGKLPS